MTNQALAPRDADNLTDAIERVLIQGDLSALDPEQRLEFYKRTCESLKLNHLTRPFEYIKLNGKLTLYARKDCTDQLRRIYGVSIGQPQIQELGNNFVVTVTATDRHGRQDSDVGVVSKTDMGGNFGNSLMKAITKAKRRVTLSICGLGMLDETEVETIPDAQIVAVESAKPEPLALVEDEDAAERRDLYREIGKVAKELREVDRLGNWDRADLQGFALENGLPGSAEDMDLNELHSFVELLKAAVVALNPTETEENEEDIPW